MTISAAQVKELREMTGAGMMDCKAALAETNGDLEAAVDWLRKKGIAKADKKAGRTAAEGLIGVAAEGKLGRHRRSQFRDRFRRAQRCVPGHRAPRREGRALDRRKQRGRRRGRLSRFRKTVSDTIKDAVGTIGENLSFRRAKKLTVSSGAVATYVHNAVSDSLGKLGVLVAIETTG